MKKGLVIKIEIEIIGEVIDREGREDKEEGIINRSKIRIEDNQEIEDGKIKFNNQKEYSKYNKEYKGDREGKGDREDRESKGDKKSIIKIIILMHKIKKINNKLFSSSHRDSTEKIKNTEIIIMIETIQNLI